jgi:hypothetical protein
MNDHRRLGRELGLYHSDPLVGAGLPIWLPAGAAARHAVEEYLREQERRGGYQHVYSPPLARRDMYLSLSFNLRLRGQPGSPMVDAVVRAGQWCGLGVIMCVAEAPMIDTKAVRMSVARRSRSRRVPARVVPVPY